MLTATQITEYQIDFTLDRYSMEVEHLFSGIPFKDIEREADRSAADNGCKFWDLAFAFGRNDAGCYVICQTIVFRTKEGYDKYKRDKPLIFDEKEN